MTTNSALNALFADYNRATDAAADALAKIRAFATSYQWDHPVIDADAAADIAVAALTVGLEPTPACVRALRGALKDHAESLRIPSRDATVRGTRYTMFTLYDGCVRILVDATGGKTVQHWNGQWETGWGPYGNEPRIGRVYDTIAAADALAAERWGDLKAQIEAVKGKRVRFAGEVIQIGRVDFDDDLDDGYYITTTDGRRLEVSGMRPLLAVD